MASDVEYHQRNHISYDPLLPTPINMICNSTSQLLQSPFATTMKKKRSLPGTPDPSAEVIALSPKTLMATNRYVCEICHKGFQREQNLQLHRRGHNLPWKLRSQRSEVKMKRVYICPEESCVHHTPCRALGDLTGIKKHYSRKHGEKTWMCNRCSKKYAVQSDWKAHSKICGTKEYKCQCGTIFSRRDSFMTHRAFCDALAQENKINQTLMTTTNMGSAQGPSQDLKFPTENIDSPAFANTWTFSHGTSSNSPLLLNMRSPTGPDETDDKNAVHFRPGLAHMSTTGLLNKAASVNWPMWPVMQRSSVVNGTDFGPYWKTHGPTQRLPELSPVVGNLNQSSADDFYYNWMNEMGIYGGRLNGFDGLTENVGHENGISMTLDLLGVEGEGKLDAQQEQQQQELEIGVD